MDTRQFKRNPKRVYDAIVEKDNKLITKEPLYMFFPQRFESRNLANIGTSNYVVGLYMLSTKDKNYAVSSVTAKMPVNPTSIRKVTMDGIGYYEFYFRSGSEVITNLNLVKDNKLLYDIFNEIYSRGYVPWYINYLDFSSIFKTASKYAGVNIGKNQEVLELLASILARNPEDKLQYYRHLVKTKADLERIKPALIALRSVQYASTNTTNKLAGSYFRPALTSAIVNPAQRRERVERLLVGE